MKNKRLVFIPICLLLLWSNCSDENIYKQGKILYTNFCANCHQENGEGVRGLVPPLAQSDYLVTNRTDLACIIRRGQKGTIRVNGVEYGVQEMPAVPRLSDFEITNVLNYISHSWANDGYLWTTEAVRTHLKKCE